MSSPRIESSPRDVALSEQQHRAKIRPAAGNRVEFRKALMNASLVAKVEVLRYPIGPRLVKPLSYFGSHFGDTQLNSLNSVRIFYIMK